MKYINIKTKEVITCSYMPDGGLYKSYTDKNGSEVSERVGDEDSLVPYPVYNLLQSICEPMKLALQAHSDGNKTEIGGNCDVNPTCSGRKSDDNRTSEQRNSDTEAANAAKPKPLSSDKICRKYRDVVSFLRKGSNIRKFTEGSGYRNYKDLPKNCPQRLVDAINAAGMRRKDGRLFTQDTVSPIVAAMKEEARPTKFHTAVLVVVSVAVAVLITRGITPKPAQEPAEQEQTKQVAVVGEQEQEPLDFDEVYADWLKRTHKEISGTRINVIKNEIKTNQIRTRQELTDEISHQFDVMVEIMNENKNK